MNSNAKRNRLFFGAVILLDFMGLATVVVSFPHLFLDVGSLLLPTEWPTSSKAVGLGFCLAAYPLGQFFGAMLLGKLSDAQGRKKVLSYTIMLTIAGFVMSAIAIKLSSYWFLLFSRLLTGLTAGNVAVAQAGLVDISSSESEKMQNITLGQMAMGSGYIVGPVLGAYLADSTKSNYFDATTPFYFFALTLLMAWLYCRYAFQETLKNSAQVKLDLKGELTQLLDGFQSKHLRAGFIVWFTFASGWWLFESFMPTFILQRFHFSSAQIGNLLAFNGILYVSFQHLVINKLARTMTPTQMFSYAAWLAGGAIILVPYVQSVAQLYVSMILFVISMGFAIPGIISAVSQQAHSDEQGKVMGSIGSIQAFATILGMALGGILNSIDIETPLILGGLCVIASWLLFVLAFRIRTAQPA